VSALPAPAATLVCVDAAQWARRSRHGAAGSSHRAHGWFGKKEVIRDTGVYRGIETASDNQEVENRPFDEG
jgi:hypothetical protein